MEQKIIVNNLFNPTTEESWVYKKYIGMKKGKQFYDSLTPEQQAAWQEEVKRLKRKVGLFEVTQYVDWVMQQEHDSMRQFLARSFVWGNRYDYWYAVATAPYREPNNKKKQKVTKRERTEKLEALSKVLAKAWYYGGWKWETPNERVMQMLMEELGLYPFKDEDEMIEKTSVDEDLYVKAKASVPLK
jgi:hypothetical protein